MVTGTLAPAPSMPTPSVDPSLLFEICDALLIDQRIYALAAEPLAIYFALTDTASPFAGTLGGKGRGYQATWEIRDGRLYLIGIEGTLAGGRAGSLGDLFPDFRRRVFAHWFSGRILAVSPRKAVGTVVLEGIELPAPTGPLGFDIEGGIVLAATATEALTGSISGPASGQHSGQLSGQASGPTSGPAPGSASVPASVQASASPARTVAHQADATRPEVAA